MTAPYGKMALLLILFLVMFFLAFVLTPLALAPLGIFAGLAHGVRAVTWDAWHFRPWFPFFPLWGFSLFFFILWIAVIVWVYKDAERRGMSGILWALLVFIGNLIGLLIFLIVRQDHPVFGASEGSRASAPPAAPPSSAPPAPAPAVTPACPSCKKPVERGFTYCPHCGAPLQPVCKSCGKSVDPAWKACPYCGAALKSE
jgi:RNA polymerase subunit RPABC4/transcription elongation factor Spt4